MKTVGELSLAGYSWEWKEVVSVLQSLPEGQSEVVLDVEGYDLLLTHMDSVYWPGEDGRKPVTKRDYLCYLASAYPSLNKHIRQRPITVIRYPQGVNGAWFYHRYWEDPLPPFVETVAIYTEHSRSEQTYLMCNNLATLLWLGEIANLELRPWFSTIEAGPDARKLSCRFTGSAWQLDRSVLNYPDFMIFELDPYFFSLSKLDGIRDADRITFSKCREAAFCLKEVLESLSLPPYVKTSGRAGLHLYVPILRNMDYLHVRSAAAAIAWLMLEEHPQDLTIDWSVARDSGKLLLDYSQNLRGKTFPSVYSPSADRDGLVSMPVRWEELDELNPWDFDMEAALDRLHSVGDLWETILDDKVDMSHMYLPPF